jgi:hypothetical protein
VIAATKDSYGVFAMTNFWDPELNQDSRLEQQQGRAMADAAAKAGVHHYIWRYALMSESISSPLLTIPHSHLISTHSGLQDVDSATGGALNLSHYAGKYEVERYIRASHSFPVVSFGTNSPLLYGVHVG